MSTLFDLKIDMGEEKRVCVPDLISWWNRPRVLLANFIYLLIVFDWIYYFPDGLIAQIIRSSQNGYHPQIFLLALDTEPFNPLILWLLSHFLYQQCPQIWIINHKLSQLRNFLSCKWLSYSILLYQWWIFLHVPDQTIVGIGCSESRFCLQFLFSREDNFIMVISSKGVRCRLDDKQHDKSDTGKLVQIWIVHCLNFGIGKVYFLWIIFQKRS